MAPPPKRRWPIVVGIVVAVVVALGVLGAVVGDDEEDGRAASSRDRVEVAEASGPTVTSGEISVVLPAGWVGADVSGGVEGVGAQLFPADPDVAAAVDAGFALVPRAVVILGFEEASALSGAAFVNNMNVLRDPTIPEGMDFEDIVEAEGSGIANFGAELIASDIIELGGRQVGRLQARFGSGTATYSTLGYVLVEDGETWVLTYSFGSVDDADIAVADGSAQTFSAA